MMKILLAFFGVAAVAASYFINMKLFTFGLLALVLSCVSNLINVSLFETQTKGTLNFKTLSSYFL